MQIIFLSNHFFFTILATDLKYFKVTSTTIHCNGGVIKTHQSIKLKIETFVPTKLLFFLLTPNNQFNFNLCYLLFYNQYVKYNFEFPKDCNGLWHITPNTICTYPTIHVFWYGPWSIDPCWQFITLLWSVSSIIVRIYTSIYFHSSF